MKIKGKPKDFASKAMKEFNDKAYHTPQDEMKADWDFSGFVVLARFTSMWRARSPTPTACRPGTQGTSSVRHARSMA